MIRIAYTPAFEALWSAHSYGNKKLAFDQVQRQQFTSADYEMVIAYLERRWKDDDDWLSGKIHHLRTILSQRHWETNNYKRRKPTTRAHMDFPADEPKAPANPEIARKAIADALNGLPRVTH